MLLRRTLLATVVALAASFTQVTPAGSQIAIRTPAIIVSGDLGGSVIDYAKRTSKLRKSVTPMRFSGRCDSACTLYLSLPRSQTCIAPGASFGFHRAYGASASANSWGTSYMSRKYPGWVRNWIAANGGLTKRIKRMDYSYASRYLRRC